ncbi:hypothetical protein L7F22_051425 [Adiantum nelumboides]|nr:hypothetical protein [Adiantum nelumboides]
MEEELTKASVETIEIKTKAMADSIEGKMDDKEEGWVEVVHKNLRKEAKEEAQNGEHLIIQTTKEEEKMRQARQCLSNKHHRGSPLYPLGRRQRIMLRSLATKKQISRFPRFGEREKTPQKERPLSSNFPNEVEETTFVRIRIALHVLQGLPIYLDDDLICM